MGDGQYAVRASHCDHRASEEEIYEVLKRTTDPLDRSWKKLEKARRIVLKFNMIKPPVRRDRNHLLIAARRGFGTVDLNEIDFVSEVEAPLAEFDSVSTDSDATVANWRRTTCEQGLIYQDEQRKLIDRYRGEFIYMQDGQVVWNGVDPSNLGSRRKLSGDRKDSALWLKYVDPEEGEGERFERYNECLRLAS